MPLSSSPETVETAKGLVTALRGASNGAHTSFRPAHAKGRLLTGHFKPSSTASTLSTAVHFNQSTTPLTIRFSSSTGLPAIPDTNASANPRGIAVRFHLPDQNGRRSHTDIIAHSTPYFPTRTGAEFLEFLKAAGGPDASTAVPEFLGRHPETKRFLEADKPSPRSFGTCKYYGVNAFELVGQGGKVTSVRYRVVPVAGEEYVSAKELEGLSETYLFDEIGGRVGKGAVEFKLLAQVAEEGDVTDDAQEIWPEEREVVELGTLVIEKELGVEESLREQKGLIFDPVPRVEGVRPSKDPLLDMRASVYLITGKERRAAEVVSEDGKVVGGVAEKAT